MPGPADTPISRRRLEELFSSERLGTYLARSEGDFEASERLYRWNAAITAAFWEPIGHLEVALRNTLATQLAQRHTRLGQPGSWLDDPGSELSERARDDIAGLWPDIAGGFADAPDRRRETVEKPIARLHDFRNRLAHHQPVWNRQPRDRYEDLLALAGYIDPALPRWIEITSTVGQTLDSEPHV